MCSMQCWDWHDERRPSQCVQSRRREWHRTWHHSHISTRIFKWPCLTEKSESIFTRGWKSVERQRSYRRSWWLFRNGKDLQPNNYLKAGSRCRRTKKQWLRHGHWWTWTWLTDEHYLQFKEIAIIERLAIVLILQRKRGSYGKQR